MCSPIHEMLRQVGRTKTQDEEKVLTKVRLGRGGGGGYWCSFIWERINDFISDFIIITRTFKY